jgi:predicted phage terminase large subunit-like protein
MEAFYGGAAGGGKSDALLMAALQYVHVPGYSALLLRRSFTHLSLPGALMDRAREWLYSTDAKWHEVEKTWEFPSGATMTFGYLEQEADKYRYQSAEFQYIGFDELTQFTESQYQYLFSRLRRLKTSSVNIRMRAASNPGDRGHDWVYQRFMVEGPNCGRVFIPAKLRDNDYLDQAEYVKTLAELDPVTREQLLNGDWSVRESGGKFRRGWFKIVDDYPHEFDRLVRYWDLAATTPRAGRDPDYTVGVLMGIKNGIYYILDVQRDRLSPQGVEELIRTTAELDSKIVDIYIEQEPGSAGVNTVDHYVRTVLQGFTARGNKTTGAKEMRANPMSSAAEAGNMYLVRGLWNRPFLDELEVFPRGAHDDQVDAASGAFSMLGEANKYGAYVLDVIHASTRWAAPAAVANFSDPRYLDINEYADDSPLWVDPRGIEVN